RELGYVLDYLKHKLKAKPEKLAIVNDYLDERMTIAETTEGPQEHDIIAGVPQGSQAELTGFAEDAADTTVVDSAEEAELLFRETIDAVEIWLEKYVLKLAKQKTEVIVLFPKPPSTRETYRRKVAAMQRRGALRVGCALPHGLRSGRISHRLTCV
ncbi:hypothetical protein J6590_106801, partial [Homalodisca vitripennis]